MDLAALKKLVTRVQKGIHKEPDEVRYHMNAFLISLGSYVEPLKDIVLIAADKIGPVTADLGDNDCKTPALASTFQKLKSEEPLEETQNRQVLTAV